MTLERPDYPSRTPEALAAIFEYFAVEECPQLGAVLYENLCHGIAGNPDLLAMAAVAPPSQPPPNLILGAVHYLLLAGEKSPLRDWYPSLCGDAARDPRSSFPAFREFCLEHRGQIEELIASRLTQTNVIQRCSFLLPAFARVFESRGRAPLALIEIGPSAGLNLQWDRFRYAYTDPESERLREWGDPASGVLVPCELRGSRPLPTLPDQLPVAWRTGVDLNPIDISDDDAVHWLRALIWPDHVDRQERLTSAIEIARDHRPTLVQGDASTSLPELIDAAPPDTTVCVYGSHTLYQFSKDALRATFAALRGASKKRVIDFVSCEGTGERCSELKIVRYENGDYDSTLAARCSPHGRWLEWLL